MRRKPNMSGLVILAVVLGMILIIGITAAAFSFAVGSRALVAKKQVALEQAMYLAEAGAEVAIAHIASGGGIPITLEATAGKGNYRTTVSLTNLVGQASRTFMIRSTGTVENVSRVITIDGVRQKTWAKYALWSHNNRAIYFKAGETFYGAVHANDQMWFSGDPEFFSSCTSGAPGYGGSIEDCMFHRGLQLNVPVETMADVDFGSLKRKATLVVRGPTTIEFQGTNMVVGNSEMGWDDAVMSVPAGSVIYVEDTEDQPETGTVNVSGTLDGRTTIVADWDIRIVGGLTYAVDPVVEPSDDALGLISGRDIRIERSFPNNGQVCAHMMATGKATPDVETDGSFGVVDYWSRPPSGSLNVHGGIVQHYRGAVGTFSGSRMVSGFEKNYTYDTRFALNPPPEYPALSDEFSWGLWRERSSPARCP